MHQLADNFTYVIPQEEPPVHTPEHPFCSVDPHCPCHEDQELISQVNLHVQEGHLTPDEATAFVQGRTV
jgi:hypothetical protein